MMTLHALGDCAPEDLPEDGLMAILRADDESDLKRIGQLFAQPVRLYHASRMTAIQEALDLRDYEAARRLTEID